jgi:hypothetical protein
MITWVWNMSQNCLASLLCKTMYSVLNMAPQSMLLFVMTNSSVVVPPDYGLEVEENLGSGSAELLWPSAKG